MQARLLPAGTTIWFVIESITDRWFGHQPYHFEVIRGEIKSVIHGGFNQYKCPTVNRLGRGSILEFPKTSDVDKRGAWLTYKEACEAADRITDDYEKRWQTYLKEPLLRPWREVTEDAYRKK